MIDDTGQLASIDVTSGKVYLVSTPGTRMSDIAFDAHKNLWGVDPIEFYTIGSDAVRTPIGPHGIPGANAIAFGPDGTLYAAGSASTSLYTIDMDTGAATAVADTGYISDGGMAFMDGKILLASHGMLVGIDPADNWSTTVIGPIGFSSIWGLTVSADGVLYGFNNLSVITIDPSTGAGTQVWDVSGQGLSTLCGASFAN